jgi:shikimate dehydrogenase
MGQPVAGNPTQFILERTFAAARLEWRCLTLEVAPEALADAVRGMRAMGFRGASIHLPHRAAVVPLLDGVSDQAQSIGAVNCISRRDDQLIGDNTDGGAFLAALRELLDPAEKRFVILGAGGVARAVAFAAAEAGAASILVISRTDEHGTTLAANLTAQQRPEVSFARWEGDVCVPEGTDVLVNATSIGLADASARVPLQMDSLRAGLLVADLVVNPPLTRLLRDASQRGCQTMHGLGMLVNQCAAHFKTWTGREADTGVMREALEEYLEF